MMELLLHDPERCEETDWKKRFRQPRPTNQQTTLRGQKSSSPQAFPGSASAQPRSRDAAVNSDAFFASVQLHTTSSPNRPGHPATPGLQDPVIGACRGASEGPGCSLDLVPVLRAPFG
ncbi:hypothetical protein PAL_GLEAN10020277 [Pteropus alecto]|uniref:Uncharacterized protein n=1 Tax=Pteropus alecto TaxID=9402 RepID=L5KTF7_PTEAL|nr:hypothetical protein PAL_GLEAN10020277 [Pteropus alecto]